METKATKITLALLLLAGVAMSGCIGMGSAADTVVYDTGGENISSSEMRQAGNGGIMDDWLMWYLISNNFWRSPSYVYHRHIAGDYGTSYVPGYPVPMSDPKKSPGMPQMLDMSKARIIKTTDAKGQETFYGKDGGAAPKIVNNKVVMPAKPKPSTGTVDTPDGTTNKKKEINTARPNKIKNKGSNNYRRLSRRR